MKLTIFQSDKGDCLMLTGADGRRMLVDGGMANAYRTHVAPALGKLRDQNQTLDVVCVSHIDDDHIGGVRALLDDEVAWRVHKFQRKSGNRNHKPPKTPRPPKVKQIWHNAFSDIIADNQGKIIDMVAAAATILSAATAPEFLEVAAQFDNLATGVKTALQVSRRINADQLNIPLNRPAHGKLMMVRENKKPILLGSLRLFVLAPFEADLDKLREEWNDWLDKNQAAVTDLRRRAKEDAERLGVSEVERFIGGLASDAAQLAATLEVKQLGNRKKVTTPNLASLMLLAEENGKTVLLTGDGHAGEIVKGLKHYGRLDNGGGMHVNVLKVQHHGSEHNIDEQFCRTITADHYVFCANGSDENPDLAVIEAIMESRLGSAVKRSPNPEASRRFTMWFNSSSQLADASEERLKHFREVEKLVRERAAGSNGKMRFEFLTTSSRTLTV